MWIWVVVSYFSNTATMNYYPVSSSQCPVLPHKRLTVCCVAELFIAFPWVWKILRSPDNIPSFWQIARAPPASEAAWKCMSCAELCSTFFLHLWASHGSFGMHNWVDPELEGLVEEHLLILIQKLMGFFKTVWILACKKIVHKKIRLLFSGCSLAYPCPLPLLPRLLPGAASLARPLRYDLKTCAASNCR